VLHSRAHRVPAERDGDLGVLRTGLSPVSLEEHRKPLRKACQVGSDGSEDEHQLGSLPGSHTLEANKMSGPEYEGTGRKAVRNAIGHQSSRWTRGLAEAALRQDLLCHGAALEHGRLCRRDPGREREPVRRGGGDSAGRLGLLPRCEAPWGGECRPWHCRGLLHGGRKHRPDPRRSTPGPRIRLVATGCTYLKPAMLTRVCGKMTLHIAGRSTTVYRKAIRLCLTFLVNGKESAVGDTDREVKECV
jgi:hypothetical protein